ncbi:MAG TPA: asparagine synthase (glutamine-hydrolyzing) [Polyangia bacterium]|nr:asparagine synthase (glutamine-hydrolyzing) [Polyangia bacterium]
MCGIAGIARFDGMPVDRAVIDAMTASIAHRGPDDHGALVEGGLGMGMRRLSIIDLSAAGHQPMFNEDRSVAVVYNGEIYNHRDLRSRLEVDGHVFSGNSDTEVLVHGYEQLGIHELATRLSGMFAFALYDRRRRRLFLVRDGFGIKPLYLRRNGAQLSFASELRALALDGQGRPSIDPSFRHTFLRVGHIPSPHTAFAGISKLAPGTILDVDLTTGETQTRPFYRLAPAGMEDTRPDRLLDRLRELLNASVRQHLIADVPTGLFLSGGLDSSALALYANQHTAPPKTFSIGFLSSDRGDETDVAAAVARRAGNENVRIDLGPANLDDLDPIVAALEDPLADSATLALWHLCRGTAAEVKVALSGEGGDEVLGGYARYFWGPVIDRFSPFLRRHADQVLNVTAHLPARSLGVFNAARRATKMADSVGLDTPARYLSWFDIFTEDERRALVGEGADRAGDRYETLFEAARDLRLDPVQRLQYIDLQTTLVDNLLLKADKISMAHSLEVRVPFLSRSLVEFGLALPPRHKIGLRRDKTLMRRLLSPRLGRRIAYRPKRGFEIPVDRWFREPATETLRQQLRSGALVAQLGFDAPAIDALIERHLSGEDIGRKLFALAGLERWARQYG